MAANSAMVAVVTSAYLVLTLIAAIRLEEAHLDEKFAGAYSDYRAGRAAPVARPFSWARVRANKEYKAILGLGAAFAYLALRV